MNLDGKVAIVTGATRGIGKSLALLLAKNGAMVIVAAREERHIINTVNHIKKNHGNAIGIKTDVRDYKSVKHLIKKTNDTFGRIDILINNAGILLRKNLLDTTEKEWDDTLDTNLKGIFLICKEAVPIMENQDCGKIINVSSGAGKYGFPELSAYCASKFGLIGLTESLSREVSQRIKVYAVCPGGVDTDMHRKAFPEDDPSTLDNPADIAEKILSLCFDDCKINRGEIIELY